MIVIQGEEIMRSSFNLSFDGIHNIHLCRSKQG